MSTTNIHIILSDWSQSKLYNNDLIVFVFFSDPDKPFDEARVMRPLTPRLPTIGEQIFDMGELEKSLFDRTLSLISRLQEIIPKTIQNR